MHKPFIFVRSIELNDMTHREMKEMLANGGLIEGEHYQLGPGFKSQLARGKLQLMFREESDAKLAERFAEY